jgi:hypothetical protein
VNRPRGSAVISKSRYQQKKGGEGFVPARPLCRVDDAKENIMSRIPILAFTAAAALALAGCGNTMGDRALSGGAIGAGAGAIGGALVGSPATGAALGGAIGAGTGALTSPNQINLGRPAWRQ